MIVSRLDGPDIPITLLSTLRAQLSQSSLDCLQATPAFSMLHTGKGEGLVHKITCMT